MADPDVEGSIPDAIRDLFDRERITWERPLAGSARWMERLEQEAVRTGRTLLTLDTRGGDRAEKLYRSMGWVEYGRLAGYAVTRDGSFDETLFFWKRVDGVAPAPGT